MQLHQILIFMYCLSVVSAGPSCRKYMYDTVFLDHTDDDDVLAIWYPVRAGTHSVSQVCSTYTGLPIERHCAHNRTAANETFADGVALLNCNIIADKCVEQPFKHDYVMKNNVITKRTNKWPAAKLGELAKSKELCLLETGLPLTRKCVYNPKHYAAEWEEKDYSNMKCLHDIKQEIVTYDLNKLYQDTKSRGAENDKENLKVAQKLTDVLAKAKTVRLATDLEISTNIMQIITSKDKEPTMVPKVLQVTNLLMQSDDNIVLSSKELGTPNTLVTTVETYLDGMTNIMMPTSKCNDVTDGVNYAMENLTSVFYINPACSNVSGIVVYSASATPSPLLQYDSHTNTYFRYLYLNQTLEEIMSEPHVEAAAYFPQPVWETLLSEMTGKLNMEAVRISLYKNTNFFVDQENYRITPDSIVLKISLPDYYDDLSDDIPLIFQYRHTDGQENPQCGYYENNKWNSNGDAIANDRNLVLCKTRRLTSFGALFGLNDKRLVTADSAMLSIVWELTLDIISIAGCGLSLFGLMCIWLTALCSKQWRSQSSNKLLLNMCFVLTLIMAYFLFINMPDLRNALVDVRNLRHCIAEGAFLQYMILVLFIWMMFLAILQYQRYVTVLGVERPRHFIAKFALVAWSLPIIPTALVICLDPASYMPDTESDTICYPSGYSLYYAVLLPISIVIAANIGIFIYILRSVRISFKHPDHILKGKAIVVQVRLSILLFFLLGIAWIFGILAHVNPHIVFSLMFCLTSTLQGFILFLYFVIFNQSARNSWLKHVCGNKFKTLFESQSTITV